MFIITNYKNTVYNNKTIYLSRFTPELHIEKHYLKAFMNNYMHSGAVLIMCRVLATCTTITGNAILIGHY